VLDVISMHLEYIDGSGYPSGLAGDAIPIEARILTVADIYEAMTAHRTYRPSLGSETALAELRSGSGSRFDPQVIAALEAILARIGNLESLDALGE
jgi:HD-GYP domain-containing protein (c-di-GMP phosphodiesterase class II)